MGYALELGAPMPTCGDGGSSKNQSPDIRQLIISALSAAAIVHQNDLIDVDADAAARERLLSKFPEI